MPQAVQVEWLLSGYMNGGKPLSSGKVFFYETDGTTLKDVYLDSSKSTTASNPVILDVNGKAEVFASDTYTVTVKDSQDVTIATLENQYYFPNSGTVSTSEIDASNFGSGNTGISLAITSAAGSDKTVYLNPGNWAISDDLTIPSNINLKFLFGAYVTIASTKTLTIQGTVEAPNYNIFKGSGIVSYDDRTNIIPSIWAVGGSHDDLTLDGLITIKDGFLIQGISQIPLNIQRNEDGVSTTLIKLDRTSASPADNDYYDISFNAENDNDQQHEFARIRMKQLDVSDTTEKGQLLFYTANGNDGNVDEVMKLDKSGMTVTGALSVSGNLTVSGDTITVNSTTVTIDDPVFTLGGDAAPTSDDNKDRGIEFRWHNGSAPKLGFFGFDDSTGKFTFIPDAVNNVEVFSGAAGTIVNNLEGNVTGNLTGNVTGNVTGDLTGDVTGNVTGDLTGDVTGNVTGNLTGTILTASQANITGVGALSAGSITSTFGNINIGGSNLTATGTTILESVGIGTASPSSKLHIESAYTLANGTSQFLLKNTSAGESACFAFEGVSSGGSTGNKGAIYFNAGAGGAVTDNRLEFNANHQNSITPHISINGNGNVGFGTTSPQSLLEISKNDQTNGATLSITNSFDGSAWNSGDIIGTINFRSNDTSTTEPIRGQIKLFDDASSSTSWAAYNAMSFSTANLNTLYERMRIDSNGNVGIGLTNPSYKLDVSGSIGYSGSLVSTSDKIMKKNIQKCPDDVLAKLLQIESKTFNYINEKDTKDYFGFIAQDLEKIFPSLVQKRSDGTLTLSYVEMIPLLLKAIQELHKMVNPTGKINLG